MRKAFWKEIPLCFVDGNEMKNPFERERNYCGDEVGGVWTAWSNVGPFAPLLIGFIRHDFIVSELGVRRSSTGTVAGFYFVNRVSHDGYCSNTKFRRVRQQVWRLVVHRGNDIAQASHTE